MAGALAERVFVDKMESVGFVEVTMLDRQPFSLEDVAQIPLFTPDLIELMGAVLAPERQSEVAVAVTVAAEKPA